MLQKSSVRLRVMRFDSCVLHESCNFVFVAIMVCYSHVVSQFSLPGEKFREVISRYFLEVIFQSKLIGPI